MSAEGVSHSSDWHAPFAKQHLERNLQQSEGNILLLPTEFGECCREAFPSRSLCQLLSAETTPVLIAQVEVEAPALVFSGVSIEQ